MERISVIAEYQIIDNEGYAELDLEHKPQYNSIEKFNKDSKDYPATILARLGKELKLLETDDPKVFVNYMKELLGDKETGELNKDLQSVIETHYYHRNYSGLNKQSRLSDELPINKKIEAIATMLIGMTQNDEYPIMSGYAEDRNAKHEIYINDDADFDRQTGWLPNGLHQDIVELFNNEQTQSIINNFKLSEHQKRKLRNGNIKVEDFEKHPELLNMYISMMKLEYEIGLSEALSDEENYENIITYISEYNHFIEEEKKKAFECWKQGKSRLDDDRLDLYENHYVDVNKPNDIQDEKDNTMFKLHTVREIPQKPKHQNPKRFEEILVNKVFRPITDEDELERKWLKVLRFYGLSQDGFSQLKKAKHIKNELGYEMTVIKQRLNPPVGFRGQRVTAIDVRLNQKELEQKFHFGDSKMIEALLEVHNMLSDPLKDENGKSIRYKYSYPIFQVLEDKHRHQNTYINNHIISKFRELYKATKLEEYEDAIVKMIINPRYKKEKSDFREDFYHHIIDELNNKYAMEIHNERQLKTLIKKLSKKISNTYLDEIEISKLGTLKCSCCGEDKVASERNFGIDKRNTNRNCLKSVCKSCDKNN